MSKNVLIKINKFIGLVFFILFLSVHVKSGDLEPSAAPSNAVSAMYTLGDIYNFIKTGEDVTKRGGSTAFVGPQSSNFEDNLPGNTFYTINELYNLIRYSLLNAKPSGSTGNHKYALDDNSSEGMLNEVYLTKSWNDETGVEWPTPRFVLNINGCDDSETDCEECDDTVTDNLTGLEWTRSVNYNESGLVSLAKAKTIMTGCDAGGYSDWRIPSIFELMTLIDFAYVNPALSNARGTAQWEDGDPFLGVVYLSGCYDSDVNYEKDCEIGECLCYEDSSAKNYDLDGYVCSEHSCYTLSFDDDTSLCWSDTLSGDTTGDSVNEAFVLQLWSGRTFHKHNLQEKAYVWGVRGGQE